MNDSQFFHALMADLLSFMGISPAHTTTDDAYLLKFSDDSKIYFASMEPRTLDAIAEAGTLDDTDSAQVLKELLALNQSPPGRPLVNISINQGSGRVLVLARIEIAHANRDALANLTWAMLERVAAARNCLQQKIGVADTTPTGATMHGGALLRRIKG